MRFLRALSLQHTLVMLVLLCLFGSLLGSSIALTQIMKRQVVQQIDDSLATVPLDRPPLPGPPTQRNLRMEQRRDTQRTLLKYISPRDNVLTVYWDDEFPLNIESLADAKNLRHQRVQQRGRSTLHFTTVPDTHGSTRWRTLIHHTPNGAIIVAARNLVEADRTVANLNRISLLIAGSGLLITGVVASLLIRRALRPLKAVATTANQIADSLHHGQPMSTRVDISQSSKEVREVGEAMNGMLDQIDSEIAQRAAAQQHAEDSAQSMRQFVADASHELRTPLASIRGFAELARMQEHTEATALPRIEKEAVRMSSLVEDLLTLARLDERVPMNMETVDLLEVITDSVDTTRAAWPGRTISVKVNTVASVRGDRNKLTQVIVNLLANAMHHTTSHVVVSVDSRNEYVTLSVEDHGEGMSEQDTRRVSERFYRTDTSRARTSTTGSGLGLAIVKEIVAAHHGQLEIDSTLGKGTTVSVVLKKA